MGLLIGVGNTVPKFPYQELWYGIRINLKMEGIMWQMARLNV